jgi:hypothetical protein
MDRERSKKGKKQENDLVQYSSLTAHSHMYTDVGLPLQVLLRYCHTLPLLEPTTVDPQHSAYFAVVFPVRVVCDHWLTAINTPTG